MSATASLRMTTAEPGNTYQRNNNQQKRFHDATFRKTKSELNRRNYRGDTIVAALCGSMSALAWQPINVVPNATIAARIRTFFITISFARSGQ